MQLSLEELGNLSLRVEKKSDVGLPATHKVVRANSGWGNPGRISSKYVQNTLVTG